VKRDTTGPVTSVVVGALLIASVPVVGWFAFTYHVAVGVMVTLIYGSGAAVMSTASITRGVLAIRARRAEARELRELRELPRARLLDRATDREP
jgi:hypothetical protein